MLALLLLLLGRSGGAEAFRVEGKVKLTSGEGALPSHLLVGIAREGRPRELARLEVSKDGSFRGGCPVVPPEEKLVIYPDNGPAFIDGGQRFLLGVLRLDGGKAQGLNLELKALPMETVALTVVKADGAPLANGTIGCRWAPTGPKPDCLEEEHEWRADSDAQGTARTRIPRGIDAACTFSVRSKNEHGDWDRALHQATSSDPLKERGPHTWKLLRGS